MSFIFNYSYFQPYNKLYYYHINIYIAIIINYAIVMTSKFKLKVWMINYLITNIVNKRKRKRKIFS